MGIYAQNKNVISNQIRIIDSLKLAFKNASHDTTRFACMIRIGNRYQNTNPDSAIYFHNKAIGFIESSGDSIRKGKALLSISADNLILGNSAKSISLCNISIDIANRYMNSNDKQQQLDARKIRAVAFGLLGKMCFLNNDLPNALSHFLKALKMNEETQNKTGQASNMGNIGLVYKSKAQYSKALEYYFKILKIYDETKDNLGQTINYGNIGVVYQSLGDLPKALEYYFKALKLSNEAENKSSQASNHANIGMIFNMQGSNKQALEYYNKALNLFEEIGDKRNFANTLGNVGIIYSDENNSAKALEYYFKSIKLLDESGDKRGVATRYGNIGVVYAMQGDSSVQKGNDAFANNDRYPLALEYFLKALKLSEEIGDRSGQAFKLGLIGKLYCTINKKALGEEYLKRGFNLAKEIKSLEIMKDDAKILSDFYEKNNSPVLALEYYKLFIQFNDSIFNLDNTKKSIQQQMNFDFDKRRTSDSLIVAEERKINILKFEQEKTQRYALYGGLGLVIIFAGFMFNRFKVTQKQKAVIELKEQETQKQNLIINEQKLQVEEKQKEILDSIHYAKRIQTALITNERYIEKSLNKLQNK